MRLFVAINFEENILDSLVSLQEHLRSSGVAGNYTKRENLHMTLAFIGEYGNPDDVLDAMESVELKPIIVRLNGVRHFQDMYLAIAEENQRLEGYVRRLRRALAENGIPFDRKKFSPHITLIRKVSYINGLPELAELPVIETEASRISLMLSERGKNGMIYTELGYIEAERKNYNGS